VVINLALGRRSPHRVFWDTRVTLILELDVRPRPIEYNDELIRI